jgi:hypothetical protein
MFFLAGCNAGGCERADFDGYSLFIRYQIECSSRKREMLQITLRPILANTTPSDISIACHY